MANNIDTALLDNLGLSQKPVDKGPQNTLGQDAFMKLLLAQLQNQDPLNPMQNGEFMTQLAQFESVSGIDDLNKSFDDFATSFQSNQALQASSLVGRWVLVESGQATLWPDAGMVGGVDVPQSSQQVLITIRNSAGQTVQQIDMGEQGAGMLNFNWDGMGADGQPAAPGSYTIEALANINGEYQSIQTYVASPVESVTLNQGGSGMTLNVYDVGSVKLSDVEEVM